MPYYELHCPVCSWSELCGEPEMTRWLRAAGKLHSRSTLETDILVELFVAAAATMKCRECGAEGLRAEPARDDRDDWPERLCAICRKPIDPERLEIFPSARLCAPCQREEEAGNAPQQIEYCPKCGSPMVLRPRQVGGITRYVLTCTNNRPCHLR